MTHLDDYLINEYLDQQLKTAGQEQVRLHLASCESCQARLLAARQLFASLEALPEVPLMVDLSRQVAARLSAEFKPRSLPRWTFPIIALQFIATLALVVWLWPVMGSALETAEQALPQAVDQLLPSFSLSELLTPLSGSFDQLAEWGQSLRPNSSLPILEGFLIIGLALIFWLAGSGLLLRQSLFIQNKSLGEG